MREPGSENHFLAKRLSTKRCLNRKWFSDPIHISYMTPYIFKPFAQGNSPIIMEEQARWYRGKQVLYSTMMNPCWWNRPGMGIALLSKNFTATTGIASTDCYGGFVAVMPRWRRTSCRNLSSEPGKSWTASVEKVALQPGCTGLR